ncbi:MAG: beta-N-acetylhexosaminidase, partial [Planctomycetota bacterium]|nr:beta-N-acetylhexosaminidase [Planctomycetota bacterium]
DGKPAKIVDGKTYEGKRIQFTRATTIHDAFRLKSIMTVTADGTDERITLDGLDARQKVSGSAAYAFLGTRSNSLTQYAAFDWRGKLIAQGQTAAENGDQTHMSQTLVVAQYDPKAQKGVLTQLVESTDLGLDPFIWDRTFDNKLYFAFTAMQGPAAPHKQYTIRQIVTPFKAAPHDWTATAAKKLKSLAHPAPTAQPLNLIPLPKKVDLGKGQFTITPKTQIAVTAETKAAGTILARSLEKQTGLRLSVVEKKSDSQNSEILLAIDPALKTLGPEGYKLRATPRSVAITASTPTGVFYGTQTLCQLLPATINLPSEATIPCIEIEDSPRFSWRGIMLDSARHFQGLDYVKHLIDTMAYYKMNRLHCHFIDDQGFRFASDKYPKLQEKAAFRPNIAARKNYLPNKPDARYGGFHSKNDLKKLVKYASDRGVVIVPEFEMPGHALASIMAYPELSCTGKPDPVGDAWIYPDVYCPGKESTFEFVEGVLDEIIEVFPSPWIHIGGDECPRTRWKACPNCQARLKELGLKEVGELQTYFVNRVENFLKSKNRRLIGWEEVYEERVSPQAIVQSWKTIKPGIHAANAGFDVVMSPCSHCYFDYSYKTTPVAETYSFDPLPKAIAVDKQKHVLGVECCMWLGNVSTRYLQKHGRVMPTSHIEFQLFPRAIALSEVGWSSAEQRDLHDFNRRLSDHK